MRLVRVRALPLLQVLDVVRVVPLDTAGGVWFWLRHHGSARPRVTRQPPVADAPAHAVAGAQLAHREPVAQRVAHELEALVHRNSLLPRHRRTSLTRVSPCRLSRVLPMSPDYSVTDVPGLYPHPRFRS